MKTIPLSKGKVAIVDDEDYEALSGFSWHVARGYARRYSHCEGRKSVFVMMHRAIANTPEGMYTDHINGDKLDNRRSNLRVCTSRQNSYNRVRATTNTSGFKGVYFSGDSNRWRAAIYVDGKAIYGGSYRTREAAAVAYEKLAAKHAGEYARAV